MSKVCEICGSEHHVTRYFCKKNVYYGRLVCGKHRIQLQSHGIIHRTNKDKNEIIYDVKNKLAYIVILNQKSIEIAKSIIDYDDVKKIEKYHIGITRGYAQSNEKKMQISHIIFGKKPDKGNVIDHINRNPLDNRKSNLREIPYRENILNSKKRTNTKTPAKGVYYDKRYKKWCARIWVNYKTIWVGQSKDLDEAVMLRKKAEIKYYGENNG